MASKSKKKRSGGNGAEPPFGALTEKALKKYLKSLNGQRPYDLYGLVMREVERPLLETVLAYTGGNQSEAAEVLGINRGTLRKKLLEHQLLNH